RYCYGCNKNNQIKSQHKILFHLKNWTPLFILPNSSHIAVMTEDDLHWIEKAVALSREGMQSAKGGPFGCVIVKDGQIVGVGNNAVTSTNDPTAHAEVVAIRNACQQLNSFQLDGC